MITYYIRGYTERGILPCEELKFDDYTQGNKIYEELILTGHWNQYRIEFDQEILTKITLNTYHSESYIQVFPASPE